MQPDYRPPLPSPNPPKPMISHQAGWQELLTIRLFLSVPFAVFVAGIFVMWGRGVNWAIVGTAAAFYLVSMLGVTIGYHRHFTHKAFKAKQALRVALAISGSMAAQGSVVPWVADHRRHHAFSDRAGDPHSPWLFGTSPVALAKGFWHSHLGWMFGRDRSNIDRFAPDLAADPVIRTVDRFFFLWAFLGVALPAAVCGALEQSWHGALNGFLWAGLARIAFQHHVTWSVNSICHMVGRRPFESRDRSANFWPLAILSMGEAWHNLHHADPTSARHGVLRGQVDISARLIWMFERFGWAYDVRWPDQKRLGRLVKGTGGRHVKPMTTKNGLARSDG